MYVALFTIRLGSVLFELAKVTVAKIVN